MELMPGTADDFRPVFPVSGPFPRPHIPDCETFRILWGRPCIYKIWYIKPLARAQHLPARESFGAIRLIIQFLAEFHDYCDTTFCYNDASHSDSISECKSQSGAHVVDQLIIIRHLSIARALRAPMQCTKEHSNHFPVVLSQENLVVLYSTYQFF